MANRVARTVGRYEILDELGRGGMATVFLAKQMDLDRFVALKELSAFRQSDPAFTRRFLHESRVAGSLSHPNIVTVHEYFEYARTPYIAMEYVDGGSLRPHIGHLALTQVVGVLEAMLSALEYAADHGIVHRDLKPENVMLTSDGRVKIADFGIAKATTNAQQISRLTATGMTVGTPNYMAPEQAMGQPVGPATDLYSLGVMAFELFVGHVPFSDTEEPVAILMRQVSDPIPAPRSVNPDIDERISDWIERLLVKEPADRVQSAGAAWEDLEEVVLDLVGPRWRRSARVLAPGHRSREVPAGPLTPPPTEAARPPLMPTAIPDEAPTRPLGDSREPTGLRRRTRAGLFAKATLLVVALIAALSAVFGDRGSPPPGSDGLDPVAALETRLMGADLALRVPRGWSRLGRPPPLGLPLSGAVSASPSGRASGPVVEFGMARGRAASNDTLLPDTFLASLGRSVDAPPARTAVRLPAQGLEAWRYRKLHPVGTGNELTVFAVPTSKGAATVACAVPPNRATALARQCDAIASTLRLRSATPYPVGPSRAYASTLNATFGDLQQSTDANQANIEQSHRLAGQAAAANALASAYGAAARQLATIQVSPADRAVNQRLVSALRTAARAYRTAAHTAISGDADAYRAASVAIPGVKAKLNSALANVRAAGYESTGTKQGDDDRVARRTPSSRAPSNQADSDSDVGDSRSDDPSDDSAEP